MSSTLKQIQQTRSAIMETAAMQAHIKRWGLSFIRAKVLVMNAESKFLTVEEKRARINGVWQDVRDVWNFPGGSLSHALENVFAAACREVLEETGYEIEVTGFLGVEQRLLDNDPCVTFLFLGRPKSERPVSKVDSQEIWSYAWLSESELLELAKQDKMRSKKLNLQMLESQHTAVDFSLITFR